jgi:hypothetical protein
LFRQNRFDQFGVLPVESLAHDIFAGGGEVAVVVVDIDQVDVVATAYPVDQTRQRFDDLGDAAGQRVGVFVFIRVKHVDHK